MRTVKHIGDSAIYGNESGGVEMCTIEAVSKGADIPHYIARDKDGRRILIEQWRAETPLHSSVGNKVVALTGEDRVGKSRTAHAIVKNSSVKATILSFATPLRDLAYNLNMPIPPSTFWQAAYTSAREAVLESGMRAEDQLDDFEFDRRVNDKLKEAHPNSREALKHLSSAISEHDKLFFVNLMLDEIDEKFSEGYELIVIDDLRYAKECHTLNRMLNDFTVYQIALEEESDDPARAQRESWVSLTNGWTIAPVALDKWSILCSAEIILDHQGILLESDIDPDEVRQMERELIDASYICPCDSRDTERNMITLGLADLVESTTGPLDDSQRLERAVLRGMIRARVKAIEERGAYVGRASYEHIIKDVLQNTKCFDPFLKELDFLEEHRAGDLIATYPAIVVRILGGEDE